MGYIDLNIGPGIHKTALVLGGGSQSTKIDLGAGTGPFSAAPPAPTLPTDILVEAWEATSLVLSDGGQVATWAGEILTTALAQATAGSRPLYRANLNTSGYPGVDFDGVDDHLFTTSATIAAIFNEAVTRPEFTIYAVLNAGGTSARWSVSAGSSSSDTPIIGIQSGGASADTFYIRDNAGTLRNSSSVVSSGTRVLTLQLNAAGLQYTWDNRTTRLTGGTAAGTGGYTFNRFAIGGLLRAAFSNASAQDFHGIYLADSVHDATNRARVWDYLTSKWGTP